MAEHLVSKARDVIMSSMRTTVTLDPDVEAKLSTLMRERGISFKETLNSAIRAGLANTRTPTQKYKLKRIAWDFAQRCS